MIIHVDRIPWEGLVVDGELPASVLGLEKEAERLRPLSPISCRLHASIVSHEILVRGRLVMRVSFVCSRCGDSFPKTVGEPDFEEIYPFADPYAKLDLTCDIRESIILAFPSFPLCKETCKGICLQCGANRNRVTCSCSETFRDNRWKALDRVEGYLHGDPRKLGRF